MQTTVCRVNDEKFLIAIYIGRAVPRSRLLESKFANPFKIGQHGDRDEVLNLFRDYFRERLNIDEAFRAAVEELRGKRLACWCAPKGEVLTAGDPLVCHGQIIAAYLDGAKE